jgi:hypothetical protein
MAGMAATVPDLGAPAAPVAVHSQAIDNVNARDALLQHGDGISNIKNPWLRGFARVGDIALSTVAPAIEQQVPGTVGNHRMELARANAQIGVDQHEALQTSALQDQQAQTQQRESLGEKADVQADDMRPFTLTTAQATALNHPELAGTQATMRDYNKAMIAASNNTTSLSEQREHKPDAHHHHWDARRYIDPEQCGHECHASVGGRRHEQDAHPGCADARQHFTREQRNHERHKNGAARRRCWHHCWGRENVQGSCRRDKAGRTSKQRE